ncbi:urease accessory protein UreD [Hymenobacter jeollabukensis]|uniref:Urease accessory protein UreD n=1 Tax=Hymenobacter jeollabukensis TaxID=2025313 RepID=A0A5R8WJG1_9BACT|nr:urease accessory protein UreD [Hymenobacter jeollabukensis]TLM88595.1 urease accessory protein UreD [Hymenobacter jeollabukensis]
MTTSLPDHLAALPVAPARETWSEIDVALVRGHSRLISSRSVQPLKLLNPRAPAGCHVVLSSYGGGMLAGDVIRLRVRAQAATRLFLGTQASTKVYKSPAGAVAEQRLEGEVGEDAVAVVFPDPVVPQAGSRYRQVQHWQLQPGALLLLADWFSAGRTDAGERFAFDAYHAELRIRRAGRLSVLDRFSFEPAAHIATSPANFQQYQTTLSVYLVGTPGEARFERLGAALLALQMPGRRELNFRLTDHACALTVARAKDDAFVLRAAARSRLDLQPLCEALMQLVAAADVLGYNPWARKY